MREKKIAEEEWLRQGSLNSLLPRKWDWQYVENIVCRADIKIQQDSHARKQ